MAIDISNVDKEPMEPDNVRNSCSKDNKPYYTDNDNDSYNICNNSVNGETNAASGAVDKDKSTTNAIAKGANGCYDAIGQSFTKKQKPCTTYACTSTNNNTEHRPRYGT